MKDSNKINRRDFLKASLTLAGSAALPLASLPLLGADEDYKAIVCILLEGGADSFNMFAPKTDSAKYNDYATVRGNMAISRDDLLALDGTTYGLHPQMTAMQRVFNENKLAVVANVGALVEPIDPKIVANSTQIYGQLTNIPNQLFAHNTQRELWMTANARTKESTGWAARTADALDLGDLINISVNGENLMQKGGEYTTFTVSDDIYAFDDFYRVRPPDVSIGEAYRQVLEANSSYNHKLVQHYANSRINEISQFEKFSGVMPSAYQSYSRGIHEAGKSLGEQLELVTRLISARAYLPKRQIYFVKYHDWDSHQIPLDSESHKVAYLDECLGQFYTQLQNDPSLASIADKVTTFTISDFGRTTTPNGGGGTDHGWGGHAFVMGGSVTGGIYGEIPEISTTSPNVIGDRMIPTTSIEQYLSPIVSWLGINDSQMQTVFPNLTSFEQNTLGFLS